MPNPLKQISNYFTATDDTAVMTGKIPNIVRAMIAFFVLVSPNMYNYFVPEVAGDVRWYAVCLTTLVGFMLLSLHMFSKGVNTITIYRGPVPLYLAGFLALMVAASLLWTASFYRTLFYGLNFIGYVGFFYLVYLLRSKQWYMTLVSMLAISVIFNSILGICQFMMITDTTIRHHIPFWPKPFIDYFQYSAPPAGTFANKNLAASFLVVALPLMFWFFIVARTRTEQVLSSLALGLGTLFFLYTRSRGSWLAFSAALVCFAVWGIIHRKAIWPVIKGAFTFEKKLILATVVLFVLLGSQVQSNLKGYHSVGESITDQVTSITSLQPGELGTRKAYNLNGIEMVKDRPLLGTGYSGFFAYYPMYHNAKMETPPHGYKKEARPQRMHNDIAQMFVELGIPAGLAWLTLFIFPLFAAWKIMRSAASNNEKFFTSVLLLSIGGMTLNSAGDFPLQMPTGAMVLWLLWAIMLGMYVMNCVSERKVLLSVKLHKVVFVATAIVFALATCVYADQMYKRNQGAWHLKRSMALLKFQRIDERTLDEIQRAYEIFPYNPRTIEHLALIQTAYHMRKIKDVTPPYDVMLDMLDRQAVEDPYGAGHLINRAAVYLNRAQLLARLGDKDRSNKYIDLAEKDFLVLLDVLPMHQDTYSTGGLVYLLKDKLNKANALYQKALEIKPTDRISKDGLNGVRLRALQTGRYIEGLKGAELSIPAEMLKR